MSFLSQSESDLFSEENMNPKMPIFPKTTPFVSRDNGQNNDPSSADSFDTGSSIFDSMFSVFSSKDDTLSSLHNISKNGVQGELTGTDMNLNLLQGSIFSYGGAQDTVKNPIRPLSAANVSQNRSNHNTNDDDKENSIRDMFIPVSYKEGLTNDSSDNSVSSSSTGTTSAGKSQKLLDLEKVLSELTTKYTTVYRLYTDDLLRRSTFLQANSKYLNKIVRDISYSGTDASAAYYYVNNFGYTHRYKDVAAVEKNDASCPKLERSTTNVETTSSNPFQLSNLSDASIFVDISGSGSVGFSRFSDYASYDMVATPCIVTRNVKTILTNGNAEYAWVDVEGKKHIYEKGVWPDKRHASCSTLNVGEPIDLTLDRYNAIPTATDLPMKEETECFKSSVSTSINTQLTDLKKKIDETVAAIKKENQNITNSVANTTIIKREKTVAEKLAEIDDNILAKIKNAFGKYYYIAVYIFWALVILFALLMIFKFAFFFITPSGSSNIDEEGGSNYKSFFGVSVLAIIIILCIYYYLAYTYDLDVSIVSTDSVYTVV
jgi:hypothetical protein